MMNQRIFELAKQADLIQWDTLSSGARTPDHESVAKAMKFAELIVAEMLKTCEDHPAWTGQMIGKQIKQHFEVEELKGWVCPKCGIDRIKEACPNGHHAALTGQCPMVGIAL
jgi:hypothetical protein